MIRHELEDGCKYLVRDQYKSYGIATYQSKPDTFDFEYGYRPVKECIDQGFRWIKINPEQLFREALEADWLRKHFEEDDPTFFDGM